MKIIAIGLVPFLWAVVFLWYCHEHYWFTYRSPVGTVFVILELAIREINIMINHIKHYGGQKKEMKW